MNNPKDMLVSKPLSSEWIAYVISTRTEEGAINVISMAAAKLRSERDELVGALRATWNALEASPCDPDITVDQIAAHAEMNKHNVPELLAKHKPE